MSPHFQTLQRFILDHTVGDTIEFRRAQIALEDALSAEKKLSKEARNTFDLAEERLYKIRMMAFVLFGEALRVGLQALGVFP